MKFERYGRIWYTLKEEAEEDKKPKETISFDSGLNAYYLEKEKNRYGIFKQYSI